MYKTESNDVAVDTQEDLMPQLMVLSPNHVCYAVGTRLSHIKCDCGW